jgi:hypothetical protein
MADVREGMAEREQEIHEAFATGQNLAELDAFDDVDVDDIDGTNLR